MGGLGSGGHNNKGRRLVEQCQWLDASDLKRRGLYHADKASNLFWNGSGSAPPISVQMIGGENEITLSYYWKRDEGSWHKHEERIAVRHRARHFGGSETYFLCPKCGRTAKRLYLGSARFLCRVCHTLVNSSTQERPAERAARRSRKLQRRLGAGTSTGDASGSKPKGMHWKTFARLTAQIHAAETVVNDDMLALLERLSHPSSTRGGRRR